MMEERWPLEDEVLMFLRSRNTRPCDIRRFRGLEPFRYRSSTTSESHSGPEPVKCMRKEMASIIGLIVWKNS